ncbi:hypothetical protein [uncultured Dialister sp.]|jgi:hypothetical protein|uniref:hypothetical protein n=1 Tax=uncultured Dialister sp. TaxID=278064 RepID=UPI0026DC5EE4|nr:hypothetical protein [uncultured Dialister sp.]
MKKHSQLKWLASLALGAGVLAAYGIHDAQAAYAALPADGTAGVVEQKEAQAASLVHGKSGRCGKQHTVWE